MKQRPILLATAALLCVATSYHVQIGAVRVTPGQDADAGTPLEQGSWNVGTMKGDRHRGESKNHAQKTRTAWHPRRNKHERVVHEQS